MTIIASYPWIRAATSQAHRAVTSRAGHGKPPHSMAPFIRLAQADTLDAGARTHELTQASTTLAAQLSVEWSGFKSGDIVQIVTAAARAVHCHPPLLEAAAAHVLRGMFAYPLFALCNILNSFARLDYNHHKLMNAVAAHLSDGSRCGQLSPTDIACLLFAYAHLSQRAGLLLEPCVQQLQLRHKDISGPNCAIILNSYARLGECNPTLFRVLSRVVVQTRPENFEPFHVSLIMNAMARCNIRKPQTMHLLANYLDGRIHLLGPQNVANVVHAYAKLDCYDHKLFSALHDRLVAEDLSTYKLQELANVVHGLAKLRSGGPRTYATLFAECLRRDDFEPRSVAQVLDAMRRMQKHVDEPLIILFLRLFLQRLHHCSVHQLTQASWCLVELDALELADRMPPQLLPRTEDGETSAMCVMRLVLERMEELSLREPLTPTQRCYVQQLIRAYHYKHELDFGLQPQRVRSFCRTMFDVPTSVTASVARAPKRRTYRL